MDHSSKSSAVYVIEQIIFAKRSCADLSIYYDFFGIECWKVIAGGYQIRSRLGYSGAWYHYVSVSRKLTRVFRKIIAKTNLQQSSPVFGTARIFILRLQALTYASRNDPTLVVFKRRFLPKFIANALKYNRYNIFSTRRTIYTDPFYIEDIGSVTEVVCTKNVVYFRFSTSAHRSICVSDVRSKCDATW